MPGLMCIINALTDLLCSLRERLLRMTNAIGPRFQLLVQQLSNVGRNAAPPCAVIEVDQDSNFVTDNDRIVRRRWRCMASRGSLSFHGLLCTPGLCRLIFHSQSHVRHRTV